MFICTEHGTTLMDDLIHEMQRQMLNGEDVNLAFQEMRIIIDEMRSDYENMSEDDRQIELVRIALLDTTYPCEDDYEKIYSITGFTRVSDIMSDLGTDHSMVNEFFNLLSDWVGSHIIDNIKFDTESWYEPTYNKECTVNELLGIRKAVPAQVVKHSTDEEVLASILEDISGACVGADSIERYNLFDKIEKHIQKIRKDNNPA